MSYVDTVNVAWCASMFVSVTYIYHCNYVFIHSEELNAKIIIPASKMGTGSGLVTVWLFGS